MKGAVEERAIELGEYIIENNATVRAAAGKFHISNRLYIKTYRTG